jgi:hypothetical protein
MKKTIVIAAMALTGVGLHAQETGIFVFGGERNRFTEQFQQTGTLKAVPDEEAIVMRGYGLAKQVVAGRPVSGKEESRSLQTLSDGTEISTTESNLFYRDSAGRTRTEMTSHGRITIVDPVAHTVVTLNTATKTARKETMPNGEGMFSAGRAAKAVAVLSSTYTFSVGNGVTTATVTTGGDTGLRSIKPDGANSENRKHEDLGAESLNGALATHTRDTLTIPQGQIGNNRDIHVVNERWYSDDLQMLVKTVNSDPRFGENTYEFTNISREEPDAALFQIPPDYTIVDTAAARRTTSGQ